MCTYNILVAAAAVVAVASSQSGCCFFFNFKAQGKTENDVAIKYTEATICSKIEGSI